MLVCRMNMAVILVFNSLLCEAVPLKLLCERLDYGMQNMAVILVFNTFSVRLSLLNCSVSVLIMLVCRINMAVNMVFNTFSVWLSL